MAEVRDYLLTILDILGNPTSTQGIATTIDLGEIEFEFDDEKRAGQSGVVSRRLTPNAIETSVTTLGMSQELHDVLVGSVNGEISFQLTASDEDAETGLIIPVKIVLRGAVSTIPLGSYNPQANSEWEFGMMANYVERKWGDSTFIYDPRNFIWSLNGKNLWQARKDALGV